MARESADLFHPRAWDFLYDRYIYIHRLVYNTLLHTYTPRYMGVTQALGRSMKGRGSAVSGVNLRQGLGTPPNPIWTRSGARDSGPPFSIA